MTIQIGDKVPAATLKYLGPEGPKEISTDELFSGKKVALFAVPGAFTGVCHKQHMPTIVGNADALKAKGIGTIAVTGVNDISVMDAWKKASNADKVEFLADGNAEFAKAIDLTLDLTGAGMGTRSKRYSMLVDDGVVTKLNVEEPGKFEVSGGDTLLKQL